VTAAAAAAATAACSLRLVKMEILGFYDCFFFCSDKLSETPQRQPGAGRLCD
jgi:hypothetical protein